MIANLPASTLHCPHCHSALTVTVAAPKVVTCPRCLYYVANPHGGQTDGTLPPLPMKVLPLETQAAGDASAVNGMLIALVVLLAVGALITAATIGPASVIFAILVLLLIIAFLVVTIRSAGQSQNPQAMVPPAIEDDPLIMSAGGHVLNYRTPIPHQPTNPGAAAGGFFSAIGICAVGFIILGSASTLIRGSTNSSPSERGLILLLVVGMVVGYIIAAPKLASRPGWRGFGTGAIIGLVLGLLALGPCAFCYLITLN